MIKYHMKLKSQDDVKKHSVRYRATDSEGKEVSFYIPKDDIRKAAFGHDWPKELFVEIFAEPQKEEK